MGELRKVIRSLQVFRTDTDTGGDEQITGEPYLISSSDFDTEGRRIEEVNYDSDGEIVNRSEFVYDDTGRLLHEKLYELEEEAVESTSYAYGERNEVIREICEYRDGFQGITDYEYDPAGRLLRKEVTDDEGVTESVTTFNYDENGRLREERQINENGTLAVLITYQYHESGGLEQTEAIYADDLVNHRFVSFYNEQGRKARAMTYNNKNQLIQINRFEYDEDSRLVTIEEEDQRKNSRTEIEYDAKGNLLAQMEKDTSGEVLTSLQREYDNYGNIIRNRVFIRGAGIRSDQDYVMDYHYKFWD